MTSRRPSSARWLKEHQQDPYVQAAHRLGYRSRSAFKLLEIQERFHLLKPGMTVIDLGAAPGGWSQVAAAQVAVVHPSAKPGTVVAVDLFPMEPLPGVLFLQGDFLEQAMIEQIREIAGWSMLLLSDMAPNMSGHRSLDQARGEYLVQNVLEFTPMILQSGGSLVLKHFQGPETRELMALARSLFHKVIAFKPTASRDRSAEQYWIGLDFRG